MNEKDNKIDWAKFRDELDEIEEEDCKRGHHHFGPGYFAGGYIYFRCKRCGFLDEVKDEPFMTRGH